MSDLSDNENDAVGQPGRDFSEYTSDGNFSVYFKLVHDRREVEEGIKNGTFYPDFVHQFFVDSERIFGYKKPVIKLFYTASRLKRYVNFSYEDKLTREKDGIDPDDIMQHLSLILEDLEYSLDLNQFISEVESKEEKEFRPPGSLIYEFDRHYKKPPMLSRAQIENLEMAGETNGNGTNGTSSHHLSSKMSTSKSNGDDRHATPTTNKSYQIFHANSETKNFKQFQARMQTLIMWFIESATMVDFEDPRWDYFMIFEKFNPSRNEDPGATSVTTEDRYFFAGYATVYRYYAYPDKARPRVSQMLLLPPYRRNHLGTTLLQCIYDHYKKQPSTLDITAEDPDEEFIAMRDFLDCKNCAKLDAFQPERLKQGWSDEIAKEAQDKLKLCHRQARKVYEILKLKYINTDDEDEYKKYRLEIKNRLNIPHQRLKLDCDKVVKLGFELPEEMRQQRDNQKLAVVSLDENYQELVRQYQHTIKKLNNAF